MGRSKADQWNVTKWSRADAISRSKFRVALLAGLKLQTEMLGSSSLVDSRRFRR